MNLKPFRQYEEADVINLYSLAQDSGNAGDMVQFQTWDLSTASDGYDGTQNLSPFAGMTIPRYVNFAKVALSTSGNTPIAVGCLLWDVRNNDSLGRPLIYTAERWQELQVVYSGQTVPILKRGIVTIKGYEGTAAPGSGIQVGDNTAGAWKVVGPAVSPSCGKFLSTSGSDGYALAFLDVR